MKKKREKWLQFEPNTVEGYYGVRQCRFNTNTKPSGRQQHELEAQDLKDVKKLVDPFFSRYIDKREGQRISDIFTEEETNLQCPHVDLDAQKFTKYDPDQPFICVIAYDNDYTIDLLDPVTCISKEVVVPQGSIIMMGWEVYHRGVGNKSKKCNLTHRLHIKVARSFDKTVTDNVHFLNCSARRCLGMNKEVEEEHRKRLTTCSNDKESKADSMDNDKESKADSMDGETLWQEE